MTNSKKTTATGVAITILALVLYEVPGVFVKVSLASAHSVCNSSLGALGEAFDAQVQSACSRVSWYFIADILLGLFGTAVAAYGGYQLAHKRASTS